MKLFYMTIALAFSLTLAAGMGSKSKQSTGIDEQKVLPESMRTSAPLNAPDKSIENAAKDIQKVEKGLNKPTKSKIAPVAVKKKKAVQVQKKPSKPKKPKAKKS